jgi:hypothetical protein
MFRTLRGVFFKKGRGGIRPHEETELAAATLYRGTLPHQVDPIRAPESVTPRRVTSESARSPARLFAH